jgi:hypothetical protein
VRGRAARLQHDFAMTRVRKIYCAVWNYYWNVETNFVEQQTIAIECNRIAQY